MKRLVTLSVSALALALVACSSSDGTTGDDANVTAGIPATAIGSYSLSDERVGAVLEIWSVSPFRFHYRVAAKANREQSGYVYDAIADVANGRATYNPSDDCSITIRPRNDGVEVRQVGTCASEEFTGTLDGTGLYKPLPKNVGDCVTTTITRIAGRFENQVGFDDGMSVEYENQLFQISYDKDDAAARSRAGDQVNVCLVELPTDCPPGDDRGKIYETTNLRTNETWTMGDSTHMCGGA